MSKIKFDSEEECRDELPEEFEDYVKEWFFSQFGELTPPQRYSFNLIHEGKNSLISSSTGSGKTLGCFLSILNELFLMGENGELDEGIQCVYVAPLKALNRDINRNLKKPLEGIYQKAHSMGREVSEIRAEVRTGDTTSKQKSKQLRNPPNILITTPETLAIVLSSPKFKEHFKQLKWIVVDEIHELSSNKRGVHLSLSLERLQRMSKNNPTRIGLSATQAPIEEIAKYLVGYENGESRGCNVVDVTEPKKMDLEVKSPVKDLIHTSGSDVNEALYKELDRLISEHESTLIFTNTRSGTERVVHKLKNKFPKYEGKIGAHHSSISKEKRLEVEESLKNGELKAVVCSTSLELGVDIGYLDLVIQLSSPKSVTRAIQRVGRSGHKYKEEAKGRIFVMDRDDLVECAAMLKCAKENDLDRIKIPKNCLDVLSQHIVGMGLNKKWDLDEAYDLVRRSYCYKDLKEEDWEKTLKYIAGKYAKLEDQHVYGKIWLDEEENMFGKRGRRTRPIYYTNIGTIPDKSSSPVFTRKPKKFVGTIEEGFLEKLRKGDIFTLAGSTYEFKYSRGMKAYVDERKNASPTIPSWFSERLPLSYDLGIKIGELRSKIKKKMDDEVDKEEIIGWILDNYYVDKNAAESLYSYMEEQYLYASIPTHEKILVEETVDEDGKKNLIFHTIYGRRTNQALSHLFAHILSQKIDHNIGLAVSDNGFILIIPEEINIGELVEDVLCSDVEEELKKAMRKTEMMKRRFRHVASRALMILRNYKGRKKSVGRQQMDAHFLFAATKKIDPDFPIIKETYREIMEDVMDLTHLKEVIEGFEKDKIKYTHLETEIPSSFAHNLILMGQGDVVLMQDKKKRLKKLHDQIMDKIHKN
ncbi:MAG: ATP-dependent helicase [Candidatus Aenigmatarchaeota archaeon]